MRAVAGLVLASGLILLAACEPPGTPSRVPGGDGASALHVPYPIADPERIEGAGRQALHEAGFVFVTQPPDPDRGHTLPAPLAVEGPVLLAHHIEPVGSALRTWQRLRTLAFGRVAPEPHRAVEVPAPDVQALGLWPPAATVWLVGPRGTCRATVGAPVVGTYPAAMDTVAVGYRLADCPDQPWAPIAIVAETIPVDFRWVPAEPVLDATKARPATWDEPLAALVPVPAWDHEVPAPFDQIRLREIPGAQPRVIQLHRALLSDRPDLADVPWCELDTAWTRTDGWTNERWIDPIPWSPDAVGPFMLGAFVNGTQVDAVIYDDRFDGLVVVPPGPLDDIDDPEAWRQVFVSTGRYDPAVLDAWGVQPARGPMPVGAACEPAPAPEPEPEPEPALDGNAAP